MDLVDNLTVLFSFVNSDDYEKGRAEQLASELGYSVFCADLYGEDIFPRMLKIVGIGIRPTDRVHFIGNITYLRENIGSWCYRKLNHNPQIFGGREPPEA